MALKQIDLGATGLDYVASCLRGWPGLCPKLAKQLEQGGEVFAALPEGTSRERVLQFKTGGLLAWRETRVWLDRELEQLSSRSDSGSLVFQDLVTGPQDPCLGEYEDVFFDGQSGVYYVIGLHDINTTSISRAISQVNSFLLVAAFCNFSFSAADVPATRILGETLIDGMADNAQEVFVSAYDREGLVVWRKD